VRTSYTDGSLKTVTSAANGSYSFPISYNWTGTVTPSHACFTFSPPSRSYSSVTTNQTSQNYAASLKPGSGCADIDVLVAGVNRGTYGLLLGGSTRTSFTNVDSGPVEIVSNNAVPLIGAERVIYKVNGINTSFSEMIAMPAVTWLLTGRLVQQQDPTRGCFCKCHDLEATVHVTIGGGDDGRPFTLAPGASTRRASASTSDLWSRSRVTGTTGQPNVIDKVNGNALLPRRWRASQPLSIRSTGCRGTTM
jgi:hypothetical protein